MLKYIASVPIVLSVIAGAYGGLNYVNKLTTQIDDSSKEIMMLQKDIFREKAGLILEIFPEAFFIPTFLIPVYYIKLKSTIRVSFYNSCTL